MELNPNHPITQTVHDHWHKIVGIIMAKLGHDALEITEEDLALLGDNEKCVVADCRGGKFVVRLMSMEEGKKLARQEGGLAI